MFAKMKKGMALVMCLCLCVAGAAFAEEDALFQVSTLNALMLGLYDGAITVDEFVQHGDFGLGTMNHLDGEMVVLDGVVYQVKADGSAVASPGDQTIPFGVITPFDVDYTETLAEPATDMAALLAHLNDLAVVTENPNRMYAVKLTGHFDRIKVRTVPAQEKPYPPLDVVTAEQIEFDYEDMDGTLVGIYYPDYLASVNLNGWHLHFLSGDLTKGGHVLTLQGITGEVALDAIDQFVLTLPDTADFASAELAEDMSETIESVEN